METAASPHCFYLLVAVHGVLIVVAWWHPKQAAFHCRLQPWKPWKDRSERSARLRCLCSGDLNVNSFRGSWSASGCRTQPSRPGSFGNVRNVWYYIKSSLLKQSGHPVVDVVAMLIVRALLLLQTNQLNPDLCCRPRAEASTLLSSG